MKTHSYPENHRVVQPAVGLFKELGWTMVNHSILRKKGVSYTDRLAVETFSFS